MMSVESVMPLAIPIGFLAGFMGTLFGVGGGTVMVPLLVLLGFDIKTVTPASLVAVFGTSLGGLQRLVLEGLVKVRLAILLGVTSVAGTLIGVELFRIMPSSILRLLLATILLIAALQILQDGRRGAESSSGRDSKRLLSSYTRYLVAGLGSLVAGALSALLGIGGGLINVPLMVLVLGLPVKTSVSTSKLVISITALAGVLGHAIRGHIDWPLAFALLAGTYSGATLSTRILLDLREERLRLIATIYYMVTGLYMLIDTILKT